MKTTDNAILSESPRLPPDGFGEFFGVLTEGKRPYSYQEQLGEGPWPELLDIPTGLGKTAAIGAAWLWRRSTKDEDTPRRLVYCLPMRTLVEQTARLMREWCERATPYFRGAPPLVHLLMGGANDEWAPDPGNEWFRYPERDAVLVGTQDMLLSRALMRGYAMSLYAWPIHFAFLHSDALWVFDEVQLMGPAIATSAQLEGLRRKFPVAGRSAKSLWCSATLSKSWLATYDLAGDLGSFQTLGLGVQDRRQAARRLEARKDLARAATVLSGGNAKGGFAAYAKELATEVIARHQAGARTIVILNQVERAQAVYAELKKRKPSIDVLLIHSRFRPRDRAAIEQRLRSGKTDLIVVATQVIEAGVDISSAVLFTELCPWDSFVQRCGRCNREGEHDVASIYWIDLQETEEGQRLPYERKDLTAARGVMTGLASAGADILREARGQLGDHARPMGRVLRRRDLLDLFSTEADLSGFHVDVSDYIRDGDERMVYVFWRDIDEDGTPVDQPQPERDEICSASLPQARQAVKTRSAWRWDPLAPAPEGESDRSEGRWVRVNEWDLFPGLTFMLRGAAGGYDREIGFDPRSKTEVEPVTRDDKSPAEGMGTDKGTYATGTWRELDRHVTESLRYAEELCSALRVESVVTEWVSRAALWHDVGKLHPVFQKDLIRDLPADDDKRLRVWAKSPFRKHRATTDDSENSEAARRRRFFRHELVSAVAVLEHLDFDQRDLIAYLVAAHHGKVRTSMRAFPEEPSPRDESVRYARGVWEGDVIPAFTADGLSLPETRVRLDMLEIGGGESGRSWTARVRTLLDEHGPFRLAWLESLVRMADWRASAATDAGNETRSAR